MSSDEDWHTTTHTAAAADEDTQQPHTSRRTAVYVQPTPTPPSSPSPSSIPTASQSQHYAYIVHSSQSNLSTQPTPTPPSNYHYLAAPTDYHTAASPLTRSPPPPQPHFHSHSPSPSPSPSQTGPRLTPGAGGLSYRIHFHTPSLDSSTAYRRRMATSPQWHLRDSPQHWVAAELSMTRIPRRTGNNGGGGGGGQLTSVVPNSNGYRPSMTHVEFHHTLDMDDTFVESRDDSMMRTVSRPSTVNDHSSHHSPSPSTTITAYPSSLPSTLNWPMHPHPLVYAGTSSGNSVHICKCRSCGSEHYNTAVYSCIERGCNFHICIQCALEQITALREQERQQQLTRRAGKSGIASIAEGKYEEDDDAVDVEMTHRVPIKATVGGAANRVSRSNRRWMTSVAASASSIGIPLLYTSAHHPHPLLYTPVTPFHLHGHIEDKLHTHTPLLSSISADRWNCSSTASHSCIAYQSPSLTSSIPTYSCSHCAYRICFPCLRHQHIKQTTTSTPTGTTGLQAPQVSQQRQEALTHLRNNRGIEAAINTYCNVVHSEESLHHRQRLGNYLIGFSSFLAVLLLHAMLLTWGTLDDYIETEWANVIIMLIFSSLAAITMKAINRLILSHQQHLTQSMLRLCNYYQELDFQQLLIPQGKHTPPSNSQLHSSPPIEPSMIVLNYRIRLSHLTPRQKHIVNAVYYLHSEIFRYQNNTPLFALLSLFFLVAAEALLAAAIVLLFVVVLCRLPSVDVLLDSCETRLGVPIGLGVLGVLVLLHLGEMVRASWAFVTKWLHRL